MEIKFDPAKLSIVPIDQVKPNTWNPKDKNTAEYEKVKESIKLHGQRQPIVVREVKDQTGYEIIDGEQKWTSCKELGFENVLIYNEGFISDQEAQELTIAYQQQVPFNELLMAKLVNKLVSNYGENIKLPFTPIEIKTFDNLANYNFEAPPQEWEGMPEFKGHEDKFQVNVSFETEEDRNEFMRKIGATIINKTIGKIWCIWYPEKNRDDVSAIEFK